MVRFKEGHSLKSAVDDRIFKSKVQPTIISMERSARTKRGEVKEVRETSRFERIRV